MEFIYTEGTLERGFEKCRELIKKGEMDKARDSRLLYWCYWNGALGKRCYS